MELFILCLKVFFVRIIDVSMGTCRTIVTVKGKKLLASLIGFFEVFIWFIGVQVITSKRDDELVAFLKKNGFGVSVIDVRSEKEHNEKYMLFIEIDKVKFNDLKKIIKKYDPNAFVVVNETKEVYNGYFGN